jgi:hypothetical protein
VLLSLIMRNTVGVWIFDLALKKYPHFSGPLVNMRETKEMFNNYSETGTFVSSPIQIG